MSRILAYTVAACLLLLGYLYSLDRLGLLSLIISPYASETPISWWRDQLEHRTATKHIPDLHYYLLLALFGYVSIGVVRTLNNWKHLPLLRFLAQGVAIPLASHFVFVFLIIALSIEDWELSYLAPFVTFFSYGGRVSFPRQAAREDP